MIVKVTSEGYVLDAKTVGAVRFIIEEISTRVGAEAEASRAAYGPTFHETAKLLIDAFGMCDQKSDREGESS